MIALCGIAFDNSLEAPAGSESDGPYPGKAGTLLNQAFVEGADSKWAARPNSWCWVLNL